MVRDGWFEMSRFRVGALVAVVAATAVASSAIAGPAATPDSDHPAAASAGATARWNGGLDADAPCPEGMTRSATLLRESFEGGIPQGRFNSGWYRSATGLTGRYAAGSTIPADGSNLKDYFFLDWAISSPGTTTMLGYATRGSTPGGDRAAVNVNSQRFEVPVSGRWRGVVHDVTPATRDEGGRLGAWVAHRAGSAELARWYLDNLQFFTCRDANLVRLSGANRYGTSVAVSSEYDPGVDTAYIARGDEFADALGGAALAGKEQGPVLLIRSSGIPESVADELTRLRPQRIVVFGGTGAIPDSVLDELKQYATADTDDEVSRLGGGNRYGTSAAISATYAPGVDTAYVATGRAFPDALSGGALAAHQGSPVVFTRPDGIPEVIGEELERLQPDRITILGGPSAVSDTVQGDLAQYTTTGQVSRIAGPNRYATSALVSAELPGGPSRAYLATGTTYPDALSGSARAGAHGAPVLLTRPVAIPQVVRSGLDDVNASQGVVLGGRSAVRSIVMDQLGKHVDR